MATSYTSLLGLALPVTGELAGTWGDTVNNAITSLLDSAVAGTTTLAADADVTLTTTTGAANQARQAILLCTGSRTAIRTITAPAQSKIYVVVNSTTGGYGVKLVGAGPTTGLTIASGRAAFVVWNGVDFVEVAPATTITASNLLGGTAGALPYQSAANTTTFLGIGASSRVLTSSGTAPQWSADLNLNSVAVATNATGKSLTIHPALSGKIGANTAWIGENSTATVAIGMYQMGSGFTTIANLNFISAGSTTRSVISCAEEAGGDAAYLSFSTRNSSGAVAEKVRITSTGNVGIGTSTPSSTLSVVGTASVSTSATTPVVIGGTGTTSTLALRSTSGAGTTGADIVFQTGTNGATEAMRILNSGNVGIGGLPSNRLDVIGPSGSECSLLIRSQSSVANTYQNARLQFELVASATATRDLDWVAKQEASGTGGSMCYEYEGTELVRIDSSGNVGIGTSTPTAKLDVYVGNAVIRSSIGGTSLGVQSIETPTSANQRLGLLGFGSDVDMFKARVSGWSEAAWTAGVSTPSYLIFHTTPSGSVTATERLRIDSAGNVLVTSSGGLGYGTGSGGAVTQITSRTTGVAINKTNGSITLVSAAGSASWQSFTVTNSTVAATDTVIVSQKSGTDLYLIHVTNVSAGSFVITFATTAGTTVEQPVFNFAVIKAVNS